MWSKRKNNIISILINPQNLVLCWAQEIPHVHKILIKSYKKELFTSLEFEKSIVFNPTKISKSICTFIKENKIARPILAMAVTGPNIFEKIINLSTSSPQKEDFKIPQIELSNWNSTYLCPSLKNGFDFYVCGMKREHLFQ